MWLVVCLFAFRLFVCCPCSGWLFFVVLAHKVLVAGCVARVVVGILFINQCFCSGTHLAGAHTPAAPVKPPFVFWNLRITSGTDEQLGALGEPSY